MLAEIRVCVRKTVESGEQNVLVTNLFTQRKRTTVYLQRAAFFSELKKKVAFSVQRQRLCNTITTIFKEMLCLFELFQRQLIPALIRIDGRNFPECMSLKTSLPCCATERQTMPKVCQGVIQPAHPAF